MALHQLKENIETEKRHLNLFDIAETISTIRTQRYELLTDAAWKFERTVEAATFNSQ
jgi:hypothetical protein